MGARRRHGDPQAGRSQARRGRALGAADPEVYAECVRLARLGWSALAVGTSQAVLDVKTYVNERVAFGEPISHRQAVAFDVANIAIELDAMRLATYRAASRADQGLDHSREVAPRPAPGDPLRHANRLDGVQLLGGHGYTKEPRRAVVPRPAAAGLMEGALLV